MNTKRMLSTVLSALLLVQSAGLRVDALSPQTSASTAAARTQYQYRSPILTTSDVPSSSAYDVIVVGSDPEGVAAAYSAGRQGKRTLLIDFGRDRVGGLYTLGWLNMIDFNYAKGEDHWYDRVYKDNFLNHGVFERFYTLIGEKKAFDIEDAQTALERLLVQAGVEVVLTSDTAFDYQYVAKTRTSYLTVNKDTEPLVLSARVVIDAMPNAEVAEKAGAQFLDGKEDVGLKGKYQSATLVYKLSGVNWDKVRSALMNDNDPDTGVNQNAAWGYKQMLQAPVASENMQSRHLNIGRQKDGTVIINAFQIFDFDPNDPIKQIAQRDAAIESIKTEIIPYMRANLAGFEQAQFVSAAPEFYVRENRHLIGEQTLRANDVFDSVFPSNYIASGSYPIDIQARTKGDIGTILTGTKPYGIAAGVLMPKGIDGIYVVSKAASMDSIAYGSARTVPVLMALGEAAGVMASTAIDFDKTTRAILTDSALLTKTRARMYDQGVRLVSYPNAHDIRSSYAYNEIWALRSRAWISMTYQNNYGLTQPATGVTLATMATLMEHNSPYPITRSDMMSALNQPIVQQLRLSDMPRVLNYLTGRDYRSMEEYVAQGMLPQELIDRLHAKAEPVSAASYAVEKPIDTRVLLTNEDLYAIMGRMILYVRGDLQLAAASVRTP